MSQPIGVCIIVNNEAGQILAGKRKNAYKAGWYGFPGGRVEVGEKLVDTARRELQEETGLIAEELEYVGVVKEHQESYDFIHFVFLCRKWRGEVTLCEPDKCEGWEWLSEKLEQQLLPGHAAALKILLKKEKFIDL